MALLLAHGYEVSSPPPEGLSPDWEAILTPRPADFCDATRPWLAADGAILRAGLAVNGENFDGLVARGNYFFCRFFLRRPSYWT